MIRAVQLEKCQALVDFANILLQIPDHGHKLVHLGGVT